MQSISKIKDTLLLSILGGICISLGGIAYLKVGGVAGAVLFAFGLLTIVKFGYKLFTGASGFCTCWSDVGNLIPILVGNVIGCWLMGKAMAFCGQTALMEAAKGVVANHMTYSFWQAFVMAMMCGIIMTIAVGCSKHMEEKSFIPLILGIPLFILCGFIHSIADAFYIFASGVSISGDLLLYYLSIVLGNYLGCNVHNFFVSFCSSEE